MKAENQIFSFYHPVASVIVSCIQKRANFINRGLFEVKNLQSENFVAEKFAITTETRLFEGFIRDFLFLQKDVTIIVPSLGISTGESKTFESERPAKYRLIFHPIDSLNNFAKGLGECGSFFCLQSILPSGSKSKYENVFSMFYSFKIQKILYAEHKGIVYLENKRMKALHRKTSLTMGCNTSAIISELINTENLKNARIKNIFCRSDSIVSDSFDVASGSLDGILYAKIKMWEAMPLQILYSALSCYTFISEEDSQDNLNKEVSFIAGSENIIKTFSIRKNI
jgi:fructose-1,6-bisphosphatase/inositol monophosphatase family enzyme